MQQQLGGREMPPFLCLGRVGVQTTHLYARKPPRTEQDKARLFANVYRYAEKVGVLNCPHYDEQAIDRTLDDTLQMASMVHLSDPIQTELLSDFILQK